jgi:competence protein ComEC
VPATVATSPPVAQQLRGHPLLVAVIAICGGIVIDRGGAGCAAGWPLVVVAFVAAWGILARRGHWNFAACLLLGAIAALAAAWHHDRWRLFDVEHAVRYTCDRPLPTALRAVALEAPRWSPPASSCPLDSTAPTERTRLLVQIDTIRQRKQWVPAAGRAELIVDGRLSDVASGDTLEILGTLQRVPRPRNPGEPHFANLRRGRRQLIMVRCRHLACISVRSQGCCWSPRRCIDRMRNWASRCLRRHLDQPQSDLASALLLGTRERLQPSRVHTFFVSGTLHMLAISGFHLGILASGLWILLRLERPPRWSILLGVAVLAVWYASLTGGRPPVVRASILIVVLSLGRGLRRSPRPWNSLAGAGLATLSISPAGLFETGTQLSFLAVGTIISWWPIGGTGSPPSPLDRLIIESRPVWWRLLRQTALFFWQAFRLSGLVWIITAPLVAYRFHILAPLGILLNLILWLPVAVALFSGWIVIFLADTLPPLADASGHVCLVALNFTEQITRWAATLPHSHRFLAGPSLWWVAGFYVAVAVTRYVWWRSVRRWCLRALIVWCVVAVCTSSEFRRAKCRVWPQSLVVSFAAVGHGTSVLIELPDGRAVLYDAGSRGNSRAAVLPIASLIWSRGINHLDAIVISHADVDHFNAVPRLLDRLSVGGVYVSPTFLNPPSASSTFLLQQLARRRVPVCWLDENDRFAVGEGVCLRVLHPTPQALTDKNDTDRGDNANSVVLEITYRGRRLLLPGDLERAGLDELLAEMPIDCDIVMAPHHGSPRSRPEDFLAWCTPEFVVVSGGDDLLLPPEPGVGDPGRKVYHTQRDGAVQFTIGQRMTATTFRTVEP